MMHGRDFWRTLIFDPALCKVVFIEVKALLLLDILYFCSELPNHMVATVAKYMFVDSDG